MRRVKFVFIIAIISFTYYGNAQLTIYDLAITHANVFNSRTGKVMEKQTILIKAGVIKLVNPNPEKYTAIKTIDAAGKLLTPGFIDTHIHLTDVFGDYSKAPARLSADSLPYYRQKLSNTYLPYGVTTVMIMGEPEPWLPVTVEWMKNPFPGSPDIYTVGGALISKEDRKP